MMKTTSFALFVLLWTSACSSDDSSSSRSEAETIEENNDADVRQTAQDSRDHLASDVVQVSGDTYEFSIPVTEKDFSEAEAGLTLTDAAMPSEIREDQDSPFIAVSCEERKGAPVRGYLSIALLSQGENGRAVEKELFPFRCHGHPKVSIRGLDFDKGYALVVKLYAVSKHLLYTGSVGFTADEKKVRLVLKKPARKPSEDPSGDLPSADEDDEDRGDVDVEIVIPSPKYNYIYCQFDSPDKHNRCQLYFQGSTDKKLLGCSLADHSYRQIVWCRVRVPAKSHGIVTAVSYCGQEKRDSKSGKKVAGRSLMIPEKGTTPLLGCKRNEPPICPMLPACSETGEKFVCKALATNGSTLTSSGSSERCARAMLAVKACRAQVEIKEPDCERVGLNPIDVPVKVGFANPHYIKAADRVPGLILPPSRQATVTALDTHRNIIERFHFTISPLEKEAIAKGLLAKRVPGEKIVWTSSLHDKPIIREVKVGEVMAAVFVKPRDSTPSCLAEVCSVGVFEERHSCEYQFEDGHTIASGTRPSLSCALADLSSQACKLNRSLPDDFERKAQCQGEGPPKVDLLVAIEFLFEIRATRDHDVTIKAKRSGGGGGGGGGGELVFSEKFTVKSPMDQIEIKIPGLKFMEPLELSNSLTGEKTGIIADPRMRILVPWHVKRTEPDDNQMLARAAKAIDKDEDGKVTPEEWRSGFEYVRFVIDVGHYDPAFDFDRDGLVAEFELRFLKDNHDTLIYSGEDDGND